MSESVNERERVCVRERESVCVCMRVCVRERERECVCVCVGETEETKKEKHQFDSSRRLGRYAGPISTPGGKGLD